MPCTASSIAPATSSARTVSIAGEHLTGPQTAESLSAVVGEEVVYVPVPTPKCRSSTPFATSTSSVA